MKAIAIDNLDALGVEEINAETAENVGGGFWGALAVGIVGGLVVHVAIEIYNDTAAAVDSFKAGFNSVG